MLLACDWSGVEGGVQGRGVSATKFQARVWGAVWETCQERVWSVCGPSKSTSPRVSLGPGSSVHPQP